MYTIVMSETKNLIHTIKTRIICGEVKSDTLRFLVPFVYDGTIDLSTYTAAIKFMFPNGTTACEVLDKQPELYNDEYIDYRLPVDSDITILPGKVAFCLEFIKQGDEEETLKLFSKYSAIVVHPHTATTEQGGDNNDERIDELEQKLLELKSSKADDIEILDGEIWLTSDGKKIGDPIARSEAGASIVWKEL